MRASSLVVTLDDLRVFAFHREGTQFTASLSLYAQMLSDWEDESVTVVNDRGQVHEEIDRRVMADIAASMCRLDQRLARGRLRRAA